MKVSKKYKKNLPVGKESTTKDRNSGEIECHNSSNSLKTYKRKH